jgi:hypothetical protein
MRRLPYDASLGRTLSLFIIIDFLGVIAGALGGAVAALGGGIIRDILIQRGPPLALLDVRYLYAAFGGALVGLLFGSWLGSKTQRLLIVVDAAAPVSGADRREPEVFWTRPMLQSYVLPEHSCKGARASWRATPIESRSRIYS